jgi:hypothetical protein
MKPCKILDLSTRYEYFKCNSCPPLAYLRPTMLIATKCNRQSGMSWVSEDLSSVKKNVFHYHRSTAVSCKRSITQSAMSRISWEPRCKLFREVLTADQTPATAARKSTPYRPRAIYSATLYRRKLKEVRSKGPILGAIQPRLCSCCSLLDRLAQSCDFLIA